MEYIKNDGVTTKKYDVIINTEKLKNIIRELDNRCFRIVHKTVKVSAYNKVEARFKLNTIHNSAGNKVYEILNISSGYKDLINYDNPLYIFDCEVLVKESSQLTNILNKLIDILKNYQTELKEQAEIFLQNVEEKKN